MSHLSRIMLLAVVLCLASVAGAAVPQLINFQGVLNTPGGSPVPDANYSVTFSIYDTPTGGTALWTENQSVSTTDGVFSVLLGSVTTFPDSTFEGSDRYLGVSVQPDPEMLPRQKLASVAYSQRVESLMGASGGLSVEEGDPGDTSFVSLLDEGTPGIDMVCPVPPLIAPCPPWITTTVGTPVLAGVLRVMGCGGPINFRVNGWNGDVMARGKATFGWGQLNNGFYGFTAGAYNTTGPNTKMPTIPGGFCNTATADYTTVGGGTANSSSGIYATVGGGQGNGAGFQGSTIAGGEMNRTNDMWATIGGGTTNGAMMLISTVGGGSNNSATDTGTTVSGGLRNASTGDFATVGGGQRDTAGGGWSTVGGGQNNRALGTYSMIPGGNTCLAAGSASLAAGTMAEAHHDCSFVWADCCVNALGISLPFFSQTFNSFNARATGGFYFATSCDPPGTPITSGVSVPPGGSAWVALSDSTAKHDVRPVNGMDVLQKLEQLNINRWKYKAQGEDAADHIGPMAQDFYRLFQVGEDNKHISTLDPDGVALAAAKQLYALNQQQQAEIDALKAQLAGQSNEMTDLKAQMSQLQSAVQALLAQAPQGDMKLSAVTESVPATGR